MEKLKPKLFSVMKTYTREQFVKDVVAGIIVAIISLVTACRSPRIARPPAGPPAPSAEPFPWRTAVPRPCLRRHTGKRYLHCDHSRLCHLFSGRKPRPDRRSDCSICNDRRRNCCKKRHGRTDYRYSAGRRDSDPDGSAAPRKPH